VESRIDENQIDFDRDISPQPFQKQQKLFDQSIILNNNAINSTMNTTNYVNSFNMGAPGHLDSSLFGLNQTASETCRPNLLSKNFENGDDFAIKKMKSTQEYGLNVSGDQVNNNEL